MGKGVFKNLKGGSKVVGNISDRAICKTLKISSSTFGSWKEKRPELYWFLKTFNKKELLDFYEKSIKIRKDEQTKELI